MPAAVAQYLGDGPGRERPAGRDAKDADAQPVHAELVDRVLNGASTGPSATTTTSGIVRYGRTRPPESRPDSALKRPRPRG